MKLTIHRGAQEIGGSCVELEQDGRRLVLDLGMPLVKPGDRSNPFEWHPYVGVDGRELIANGILPDIRGLYEWDSDSTPVDGLVVSHGHQDHYGLARFVRKEVPVFMSRGSHALMAVTALFVYNPVRIDDPHLIEPDSPFDLGPFTITGIPVDHSAPDAQAFLVEAGGRRLLYSGDLRGHGRTGWRFENMINHPPENIHALLLEGTTLGRPDGLYESEADVEEELVGLMKGFRGLPIVFSSSQNLDRLISIYRATIRSNRSLVIDLYTAYVLRQLASLSKSIPQMEWDRVRVRFVQYHARKLRAAGQGAFVDEAARWRSIDDRVPADPSRWVVLAKNNDNVHELPDLVPDNNDLLIVWSLWSGYLERENPLGTYCRRRRLPVQYVHTSGHATPDDLRRLVEAIRPEAVIPIHTFHPERCAEMFGNAKLVGDGERVEA